MEWGSPLALMQLSKSAPGDTTASDPPLLRMRSQCPIGDVLYSLRCDWRTQLRRSLYQIPSRDCGIGYFHKLRANDKKESSADSVLADNQPGSDADPHEFEFPAVPLDWSGVNSVHELSNNPGQFQAFKGRSIPVPDCLDGR